MLAKNPTGASRALRRHHNSMRKLAAQSASIVALIGASGGGVAMAQQSETNAASSDTIVVTARFRNETVQEIGGSVAALDDAMMTREGVADFEDIAARVAGLNLNDRGPNQNDVSIRGISNGALQPLADTGISGPLVSQFIDDVPVAQSTGSQRDFSYFDFDRVEVLRGPQPTFFGEGSVGGTIRYATRSPDLSGATLSDSVIKSGVSFTKDGGTNYSVSAASSLILVPEKLGLRGVINYREDDGFIDSSFFGTSDINDYESISGRVIALFEPTEQLSVRLMGFWGSDDIGENNAVAAPPVPVSALVSNLPVDGSNKDDFEIYTGKIDYDFGALRLSSITGLYERSSSTEIFCGGCGGYGLFLPVAIAPALALENDDRSFTQELRIVSEFDSPLSFIAGFYYQDTELTSETTTVAEGFGDFVVLPAGSDTLFEQFNRVESEQYSGFVEFTYELTDRLRLISGVRYVNEKIVNTTTLSTLALGGGALGLEPPFVLGNLTDFVVGAGLSNTGVFELDKFLPRGAVEFDAGDNLLLYASAATGSRNGNLNPSSTAFFISGGDPVLFAEARAFSDDDVLSYEAGAKGTWMDGALTTNFAVYHTSFDNPQVEVSAPFVAVENGPELRIVGVELETAWRLNDYVDGYFNGAFQDSEFLDNQLLAPATLTVGVPFDLRKGNRSANTPKWSFSAGANASYPISGDDLFLTGHVGYSYTGARFSTVTNVPSSEMEPLGLLNLRLGFEGDNWSVVGFVSNATNDVEYVSIGGSLGLPVLTPGGELDFIPTDVAVNRPRTMGVEATLRF